MQQNLARAWRSKNFDEIVGQELTIRLLKNSLAKNRLFPVYLFSGLRGSGKTSTGRIFAAAINCQALAEFQAGEQQSLPCLTCPSCVSMRAGNHPDFVEIDAASHTGVDNIRQIIESASFLPVMGSKKVYLIDEAHMLSKAAFNAFLKILEEPPTTVVFLLATTEAHKILDTVISRSFQLFFDPIPQAALVAHLKHICNAEQVECEDTALAVIAQQSEGSVRDALTIMERIILAEGSVTYDGTHRALGLLHDRVIIRLFELIGQGDLAAVLEYCAQEQFERHNSSRVWDNMVAVLRALLWVHHGQVKAEGAYALDVSGLQDVYTRAHVLEFFELFYRAEPHFLKTSSQQTVLEALMCKMVQRFDAGVETVEAPVKRDVTHRQSSAPHVTVAKPEVAAQAERGQSGEVTTAQPLTVQKTPENNQWQAFLQNLEAKNNPIATSIFKQGVFTSCEQNVVNVRFAKKFEFYHDWMVTNEALWRQPLEGAFGAGVVFKPDFVAVAPVATPAPAVQATHTVQAPSSQAQAPEVRKPVMQQARPLQQHAPHHNYEKIDIQDTEKWRMANMVTEMFPGTITRKE